jgi:hypothetical protein
MNDKDWNPPAWLAPNNRYITAGYGYQFIVMAANARDSKWTPLYPKREWVELTRDDVDSWPLLESPTVYEFVKYIEAKLKEKNT